MHAPNRRNFHEIQIVTGYRVSWIGLKYCRVDRNGTGASDPRGGFARDFVNFREKKNHAARVRRGRACHDEDSMSFMS